MDVMCTDNEEEGDPPKAKNACLGDRIMDNVKCVPFETFLISYKEHTLLLKLNTECNILA